MNKYLATTQRTDMSDHIPWTVRNLAHVIVPDYGKYECGTAINKRERYSVNMMNRKKRIRRTSLQSCVCLWWRHVPFKWEVQKL